MLFFKVTGKFKIFSGALIAIAYAILARMTLKKAKKKDAKEYNSDLQRWHKLTTTILAVLSAPPYSLVIVAALIWNLYFQNMYYDKK